MINRVKRIAAGFICGCMIMGTLGSITYADSEDMYPESESVAMDEEATDETLKMINAESVEASAEIAEETAETVTESICETEETEVPQESETEAPVTLLEAKSLVADGVSVTYKNAGAGYYKVSVTGLRSTKGAEIQKVNMPIWSDEGGMDDMKCYTATFKDGVWTADVYISNHKYDSGTYHVQAYAYDVNGEHNCVVNSTFSVEEMTKNYLFVNTSADKKQLVITAKNTVFPEDIKYPAIAVWGRLNEKNDMKWYTMTEISEKTYRVIVPISNHKESGVYTGQLYAFGSNANTYLNSISFKVDGFSCTPAVYTRDDQNGYLQLTSGTFLTPAAISDVNMVVWSDQNGADDIKTYKASLKDGQWIAEVDIADHHVDAGIYHVVVYATDCRGIHLMAGKTDLTVVKPTVKPKMVIELDEKTAKVNVTITDLLEGTDLALAAWGDEKGQNDLTIYQLTKKDNRTYTGVIDLMKHKEKGKYQVYLYATVDGKRKAIAIGNFESKLDLSVGIEGLQALKQQILNIAATHSGTWSVYVKDLKTNEYLLITDQAMVPACTIKLFALEGAFRKIVDGQLDYPSCYSTLYSMITVSDNECFNEMLRRMGGGSHQAGTAWLNNYVLTQGYSNVHVSGSLQPSFTPWVYYGGRLTTSAKDCGRMLERVYRGTCVSPWASTEMLNILKNQRFTEKIPAALPGGVVTANKTGDNDIAHNDACIVFGPKTDYVICVFSNYFSSDWDSLMGTREISAAVYRYLN